MGVAGESHTSSLPGDQSLHHQMSLITVTKWFLCHGNQELERRCCKQMLEASLAVWMKDGGA